MKKKIIVIIIIFSLAISLSLFLVFSRKRDVYSGEITVVAEKTQNDDNKFNRFLLNLYTNDNREVIGNYTINPGNNYLDYIVKGLTLDNNEDIYYTVFSSQLYDKVLKTDNIKIYTKFISKDLPKSFYSFTNQNGNYLYIPITWSPWGIYYNKEIFNRLNLREPTTIEELEEINTILLDNDITPFSMMQKLKWPFTAWFDYLDIRKNGVGFHNQLLDGLISFTDPKVVDIFTDLHSMISSKYFYESSDYDWKSMLETLSEEKTAMLLGGTFYYENASESLKNNMGWFPFPLETKNDNYDEIVTSSGYLLNENSDNPEVVDNFVQYVLSEKGQKIIEKYTDFYPVNKKNLTNYNRDDLNEAYKHVSKSNNLIPSFERNTNSKIQVQLKSALNNLFEVENDKEIIFILNNLEEYRLSNNK